MEYVHGDFYQLIVKIMSEATFAWLSCETCLQEATKMIEERVKCGASGFNIMMSKLLKRRKNVTGFQKLFFTHFWAYAEKLSAKDLKEISAEDPEHGKLAIAYDLLGKIFISLAPFSEFFNHIVTKLRATPVTGQSVNDEMSTNFKAACLRFMGVPPKREVGANGMVATEKPVFRFKQLSDVYKSS